MHQASETTLRYKVRFLFEHSFKWITLYFRLPSKRLLFQRREPRDVRKWAVKGQSAAILPTYLVANGNGGDGVSSLHSRYFRCSMDELNHGDTWPRNSLNTELELWQYSVILPAVVCWCETRSSIARQKQTVF
jgi:hypothetical protein